MAAERTIRLGTRGSALARWQTDHIAMLLQTAHPGLSIEVVVIGTHGDRVLDTPLPLLGGKGVFTAELEAALRSSVIDFAVHSLKDLPTETPEGLVVGAIPARADAADALVSGAGYTLATLPAGASVGTSSRRRAAQLLHLRPDLHALDIRGNVDTRLRKAFNGEYDAILLACAGLERLGRLDAVTQRLSLEEMLPAPGQGALAVQCRDEAAALELLAPISHAATTAAVRAERAFLAGLGGGCALPIAAYAEIVGGELVLRGRVSSRDGAEQIDAGIGGRPEEAETLGCRLADEALARVAAALLETEA